MLHPAAWLTVITVGVYILGVLAAINAIMKAHTSQGAIAWAIALLTFPYLALPLYVLFGSSRFHGYVNARRRGNSEIHQFSSDLANKVGDVLTSLPAEIGSFKVLEHLAGMPFTSGNDAKLLINGEAAFTEILAAIAAAKDYILVQFFIIRDDRIGGRLHDALANRVRQGVRVHVLFDPIGCYRLADSYIADLRVAGAHVHPFTTIRSLRGRFQLNFRNHRKLVIVDGTTAFMGGMNVGDEYLGRDPRLGNWRDTHVQLWGPTITGIQLSFVEDYYHATGRFPELNWEITSADQADRKALILPTGPADTYETCGLFFVQAINAARYRLWLTSPYFVPNREVVQALQLAALRGVDVRIMLPERPDHLLVYLSSFSYLAETEQAGVKFYRYQPGFLHQKVMLIDDQAAAIGTANLDNRSFRLNFEITLLMVDKDFASQVEDMLLADFENCRELKASEHQQHSFFFKVAVRIARLLSPVQ